MHLVSPKIDRQVGRRLKSLRKQGGISVSKLAEDTGFSVPQIQEFELGESRIAPSVLWDFCGALGVRVGDFFADLEITDPDRSA